ncbi:MAG: hypothetical protein OEY33_06060 [Bdellovibrionales bacterium]|jgi:hypothetical protein|nr:hypothetical protein [Bdellovibrionales bacterium]
MFKKLTSFTVLLTLVFAIFAESDAISTIGDSHEEVSVSSFYGHTASVAVDSELSDGKDEHCPDGDSHCVHHCTGLHNLILTEHKVSISNQSRNFGKVTWYYKNHYISPFFEPALKPPLYS